MKTIGNVLDGEEEEIYTPGPKPQVEHGHDNKENGEETEAICIGDMHSAYDYTQGILADVVLGVGHEKAVSTRAFIDTGALTSCLINKKIVWTLVKQLGVPVVKLQRPRPIAAVNDQPMEPIRYLLPLPVTLAGHYIPKMGFYVADLGRQDVLVGL